MVAVHSFDIFDTVLVRRVAISSDVIRLTGEALARRESSGAGQALFLETFLSARDLAAARAQKASQAEDCTIDAIWEELARLMPGRVQPSDSAIEIGCDARLLLPNPVMAARIASLRAQGRRVIFISDIYYRRETLFEWLNRFGLCDDIDEIYASSEIGLLKHTGSLFDHVLAAEGIAPDKLHHAGDNISSDHHVPARKGIRTEHYTDTRLTAAEKAILATPGGGMAASRMAAAMRLARLQDGAVRGGDEVTAFLGPLGVLTACWTASFAHASGAPRIYFVARDGYVPWRAATSMPKAMAGIDVRYIRLSRNSLIAAIPRLGEFGVFWIKASWGDLTAGEIVERLGYRWDEIEPGLEGAPDDVRTDHKLASDAAIAALVAAVDNAVLSPERRAELDERRANVVGYLRQEGMFDGTPFVIFDVGWYLNLQAALKSILDAHGADGFVAGAYFALSLHRVIETIAGPALGMFHQQPWCLDWRADANFVFDRRILVEHLLGLAPHGSAKGYAAGEDGRYFATEAPISQQRQAVTQELSDRIAAFAKFADEVLDAGADAATLVAMVDVLIRHYVAEAHRYDFGRLEQLYAETDGRQSVPLAIPEPWRVPSALAQLIPYRVREKLNLGHGPTLWPEMAEARAGVTARWLLMTVRNSRRLAGRALRR